MAAASQLSDGAPSPYRSYVVYGLTAATSGLIAYSFYNSLRAGGGLSSPRQYSTHDRADAPSSFTRRLFPNAEDSQQKKDDEKQPDKEQDSSYLKEWSAIGDRIRNFVVPDWAQQLPDSIVKLQKDLSDEPGTLADEMWKAARDSQKHPEITRDATVRISDELCPEESEYLVKRKRHLVKALAKYLDLDEKDIHPDDVPTIGMCGSGGGLRAMVAGASSYLSAQEAGLFDCITYTAGVSGSCWLQALYNSSITHQNFGELIEHLKQRISTHIAFPPPVLQLLTSAPTNEYLLAGGLEKFKGYKDADFGLVDVYGLLLGARLLVPKGSLNINPDDIKLSRQRQYVDDGSNPLPLYTAVRHEIPPEADGDAAKDDAATTARKEAWFQWFEFSPYELFSEELGAGIPTWAVGRRFDAGKSMHGENDGYLPETRLPLLMGIFGSAFCATLSHYYKEIKPLVAGLPGFGSLDALIGERDDDLVKVHPVAPAQIPNYARGLREQLPARCPESIHATPSIQLMDAGMSNNLPIYPLLRPGRDVDVVIAFDASADIKQDNWLRVVDGYARQRGVRGWPLGCGWPDDADKGPQQVGKGMDEAEQTTARGAQDKLARAAQDQAADEQQSSASQARAGESADRVENHPSQLPGHQSSPPPTSKSTAASSASQEPAADNSTKKSSLGYCTVWVGSTTSSTTDSEPPPPTSPSSSPAALQDAHAGIAVVYFPFLANPATPHIDPSTSAVLSTWNFIYEPDQVEEVVQLARANFRRGESQVRDVVRAVYERKRRLRMLAEEEKRKGRFWDVVGAGGRQTLM